MRIVSHTCSNTEIVCALGAGRQLVGVDDDSDHPADVVAPLPKLGRDLELDVARVAALRPDLVLTSLTVPGHERIVEALRQAGLPVLVIDPIGLDGVYDSIAQVAEALGMLKRDDQQSSEILLALAGAARLLRPASLRLRPVTASRLRRRRH